MTSVQLWDPMKGTTKARQTPCENTSWEERSCVFYDTSKYPPLKHQLPTLQLEELIHFTLRVTYSSHILRTCASLSSPSPPPQPPPSPPRPWPLLPPFSTSQNLALSSSPLSLHHRFPTFPLSLNLWKTASVSIHRWYQCTLRHSARWRLGSSPGKPIFQSGPKVVEIDEIW